MPGGRDLSTKLKEAMKIDNEHFEARWAAD
jgi:hypothetical protein